MVHVEESLQLPRDFEGKSKERTLNTSNLLTIVQALVRIAMTRNGPTTPG